MPKHIFECIDAHTCGNPIRLVVSGGPKLDGKIRSLCTIAALIVLDKPNQLPGHITGALNYGWSKEEIVELITQMLFYGGYPTAVNSLAAAAKTFAEYDERHNK